MGCTSTADTVGGPRLSVLCREACEGLISVQSVLLNIRGFLLSEVFMNWVGPYGLICKGERKRVQDVKYKCKSQSFIVAVAEIYVRKWA